MAVPPRATTPEEEQEDGEFTFPTPPPLLGVGARGKDLFLHPAPASASASACSSPPVWLLSSSSSPIRRSFSAADCAASPWRDRALLARLRNGGYCSPALSDYAGGGFCEEGGEEDEERMDSLWEDLNDDDDDDAAAARGEGIFFGRSIDVSRRRSVAANAAEGAGRVGKDKDKDRLSGGGAVLGASRSSRRRPPGLVAMMRGLRRMFVAHKAKSRVHRDEQSTASASASASAYSFSRKG